MVAATLSSSLGLHYVYHCFVLGSKESYNSSVKNAGCLAKWIANATVHLDLSCFVLVLQKKEVERVACAIHFASTQHF